MCLNSLVDTGIMKNFGQNENYKRNIENVAVTKRRIIVTIIFLELFSTCSVEEESACEP